MNTSQNIDVFISRKSEDAPIAKSLYDFLKRKGLQVFDSDYSLPQLGDADYQRTIDHALEACKHMIVVGSSVSNICSPWVEAEWRLFISEKRAGYKPGNILTVVPSDVVIRSLPTSLRYYEVITLDTKNYDRIHAYVERKTNPSDDLKRDKPLIREKLPTASEITAWYTQGVEFYNKKDYIKAALCFSKSSDQGNANAQSFLGYCYEYGYGVPQDYGEAAKWYRKAADQGDAKAQSNLGVCYENGQGVSRDYTEAVKWYRQAAEQGDANAQYGLGKCYESGRGVSRDYGEAVKWYNKAADQGDANALYTLGEFCYFGQGIDRVAQNYSKAAKWYRKAAEQSHARAQYNLGHCYEYGKGVEKSMESALLWYKKAAVLGEESAKERLKNLGKSQS